MRAKKIDANQREIVDALRKLGATVQSLAPMGHGCPDLLVGHRGVNVLMEIKDGTKLPSQRQLTPDQELWHKYWRGQVCVVESVEQAIREITA